MFYLYARRPTLDRIVRVNTLTSLSTENDEDDEEDEQSDITSVFSIDIPNNRIEETINEYFHYFYQYEEERQKSNDVEEKAQSFVDQILIWLFSYFKKCLGLHEKRPKRIAWHEYFWSFLSSFIGILVVALMHYRLLQSHNLSFLIGSFGASAVLIYGAPSSPLAQPRNLIGGHFISAVVGCIWRVAIYRFEQSVTAALAVATSIVLMQLTETVHPPGGATALIAVTIEPALPWANFLFIFVPVLTGALVLLIVAILINNLSNHRTYPSWWF